MKVEANRTSWFGWDCSLRMDGRLCGVMGFAWTGRSGTIVVGGDEFQVRSQGVFGGMWDLWQGNRLLASAKKKSFPSRVEVDLDGMQLVLQRPSLFSRSFTLMQGARTIGRLERAGWFSRTMVGELPDPWPPHHRAFAMWLVMMMWRRQARSSSS